MNNLSGCIGEKQNMENIEKNIDYVKQSIRREGKVALCCILFGTNDREKERIYYLSHSIPASHLLGEIEMWKMDIQDNLMFDKDEIECYMKMHSDIGEINE